MRRHRPERRECREAQDLPRWTVLMQPRPGLSLAPEPVRFPEAATLDRKEEKGWPPRT